MLRTLAIGIGEVVHGMLPGADGAKPGPGDPALAAERLAAAKAELRRRLVAGRRAMTEADRAAAGRRLRDAVLGLPEIQMAGTIAAYCSIGSEPDTRGLLFALWKRGSYVLLPVLLPDGDLDWASYEGPDSLTAGPRGLLEPGPAEPRRGPGAIARADLVLVPALAADRSGNRLGKGGGSYDRALARVGGLVPTVALLFDGELLDEVPAGPHDVRVRLAAQPQEGIIRLA
jgi:5-formyltetrahydrofolate cyclo-ligase